ncbi:MAG TPA: HAD-IA family hydrolase [Candidatus Cloacimonadota bacterium]|nr:HAD-IA family hydrolase [Candidatus Cloacimonadota bacterium]HPS39476.1 HAD-IA family hydrolase [Candidatus Cloacimonadota bacterium]
MAKKPYLLFDFDGTIANSIDLIYGIMNKFAPDYGMEPVSREDFEVIRSMDPRTALSLFKIPFYRIPFIISRVLKEYKHSVDLLHPYPGIPEMLSDLAGSGIRMALLSSNHQANVMRFLVRHKLNGFEWVEGTSGVMRKHNRINKMLRRHRIDSSSVIYVGDESRDIQAAKLCGIRVISVTWGFHTQSLLQRFKPDFIVNSPQEIKPLIDSIWN